MVPYYLIYVAIAAVLIVLALLFRPRDVYTSFMDEGQVLVSRQHMLRGKPDAVLKGRRGFVPVEVKSSESHGMSREWDVAQLLAYCLIVEEAIGPVSHGILRYSDCDFQVPWDRRNRMYILSVIRDMSSGDYSMTADTWKCRHCQFRLECRR